MSDDTVDSQVAEQMSDKSFGDGFSEETAPVEKASEESKPKEEVKAELIADAGLKTDKPKVEQEPAKEPTAQERMEKMAQESVAVVSDGVPSPAVVPAPVQAPVKATPEQSGWIADLIKSPEVAGVKVGVTGKEMTVAEFAEEYPEALQAPVTIAKAMLDKAVKEMDARYAGEVQGIRNQLKNMQFWDGIHQAHSDGRKVAASIEFNEWVAKQSPLVAKMVMSENVDDGVAVIDAYKEFAAKTAKKSRDNVATKQKEMRDGLHGDSLRDKPGFVAAAEKDKDDFDAGFSQK